MKQKKIISLPTNQSKIYRQILAFMNFLLNLTPQEQDVLAEIIRLDDEYEVLSVDKRAKFILSTEMRKEMRLKIGVGEKQFNILLGKLKKKTLFGTPLLDDKGVLHPELKFKPDSDGFKFEVNFVMTAVKPVQESLMTPKDLGPVTTEKVIEELQKLNTPPQEYKYDAAKAPIIEEETFEFSLTPPND